MQTRLSPPNVFNTAFLPPDNAIPTSGSATFTGFANVNVTQAGAPLVLTGPASVQIDFGTRDLTGSATGFTGVEGSAIAAYSGTVSFENGRIGRDQPVPTAQQPNDVRLGYTGVLTGEASILNAVAIHNRAHEAVGALVAAAAELAAVAARSAPGTLQVITDALRDENNNPVPAGTVVPRAYAIRMTDDALVKVWTDQVTNSEGSLVLADAALTAVDHVITLASNVGAKPAGAKVYVPA
jgi:hypothetical protein